MTLTKLSGKKILVDLTYFDKITQDGAMTRLIFQKEGQLSQIVVRETLKDIKLIAGLFDHLANHYGVTQ